MEVSTRTVGVVDTLILSMLSFNAWIYRSDKVSFYFYECEMAVNLFWYYELFSTSIINKCSKKRRSIKLPLRDLIKNNIYNKNKKKIERLCLYLYYLVHLICFAVVRVVIEFDWTTWQICSKDINFNFYFKKNMYCTFKSFCWIWTNCLHD